MAEDVNDAMLELLEQLDTVEARDRANQIKFSKTKEKDVEDLKPSEAVLTPVSDLVPVDVRSVEDQGTKSDELIQPSGVDLSKYLSKLDDVTDSVLSACAADRKETQGVINIYRTAIDNAIDSGEDPSRMWVDGLVKAVEVKASINNTAVKVMEATAKMLAATKSGISINQQFNGPTNLSDILDEPMTDEDEY